MKLILAEIGLKYMTLPKTNNINTNQNHRLSVQISLNGLSFLIKDNLNQTLVYINKRFPTSHQPEELLLQLEYCFHNEPQLRASFKNVVIIYHNDLYTLVPKPLFEVNKASEYLKFNIRILENDTVSFEDVGAHKLINTYIPFININNYIFEKFGDFSYYHSATLLCNYLLDTEKYNTEKKVFVYVSNQIFHCIAIENGNLLLCNTYMYQTPEDFIYYVLFNFEQLNLNPEKHKIILSGGIAKDDSLYKIVYTYIRNVSFLENVLPNIENVNSHHEIPLKISVL